MRLASALLALLLGPLPLTAQEQSSPEREARRQAALLDGDGKHAEARVIWQRMIDQAPDAAARASAQRRMAMSHGFEGDCAGTIRYHTMVIEYWKTREAAEPQNAFYQQGEMANESARVCLDADALDQAERMYRLGYELGTREPEPRTHPKSLWDFRMAHALGRLAARRGDQAAAERHVAEARRILDSDPKMAEQQERFYPYLAGYVALYTNDLARAQELLTGALGTRGNEDDPFLHALMALTHEKMGHAGVAREHYAKAFELAQGGHNPPAAYTRRVAAKKLAELRTS